MSFEIVLPEDFAAARLAATSSGKRTYLTRPDGTVFHALVDDDETPWRDCRRMPVVAGSLLGSHSL